MANHAGKEGSVAIGANTIAEITGWSITENVNLIDNSVLADTWATHLTGLQTWDGSVDCFWDETDTNGQLAMTIGASVTLNLYPEGSSAGDAYFTGTATINSIARSAAKDGMVEVSFTFTGNGALTSTTVGA